MNKTEWKTDLPVIFIIFNRYDTARRVFEAIKEARPRQLFVISDGPRKEREGEAQKVLEVRRILDGIDWNCELHTCFSDVNMGCDKRIETGISWAFETVDRAVILEDDCLPTAQFFEFCDTMLKEYAEDDRIAYISGTTIIKGHKTPYSYFYSYLASTWGWATWRNRWEKYEYGTAEFERKKDKYLKGILSEKNRQDQIADIERHFRRGSFPWDYIWQICMSDRLRIIPAVSLVSNIGFSGDGTHTIMKPKGYWEKTGQLQPPYVKPSAMEQDVRYMKLYQRRMKYHIWNRVAGKCRMILREWRRGETA